MPVTPNLLQTGPSCVADSMPAYDDFFCAGAETAYTHAVNTAREAVVRFLRNNTQPFSGVTPAQLAPLFNHVDFTVPLGNYEALMKEAEALYVNHAVAFHLPQYMAHLNCPVVLPAVAAEVLIAAINSSLDTWDQSAGGTLMEQKLVAWTCHEIGFGQHADGVFTSGGTQSNLMGLLLARDWYALEHLHHDIRKNGLPASASRFRIFVSEMGHFSVQKNAELLGLGQQCVVKIKTDRFFRMNTVLLEDAIARELKQGNIPIAIVATAGTTDFGNIDPLQETGRIAERYKLWYHVDAAYGCGLLLSSKHRHLLNGIELAHSVTADYHKSFFQPVSSSAFLVKHKHYLSLVTHHADYLNPKEQEEDGLPNQVNKSIQTTRRFDALKLWFTLRLMGKEKLGAYFDTIVATAAQAAQLLEQDPDIELLNHSDISTLVFRFRPGRLAHFHCCEANQYIRKKMFKEGAALVAGTRVNGSFYLKCTLLNPLTTIRDFQQVIQIIKQHGTDYIQLN